jgi:hypothetical protein
MWTHLNGLEHASQYALTFARSVCRIGSVPALAPSIDRSIGSACCRPPDPSDHEMQMCGVETRPRSAGSDVRAETKTSPPLHPALNRLAQLLDSVLLQLDELLDAWCELTDVLAERAELFGAHLDGSPPASPRDDENALSRDFVADVVRRLQRQLSRLRAHERALNVTTSESGTDPARRVARARRPSPAGRADRRV